MVGVIFERHDITSIASFVEVQPLVEVLSDFVRVEVEQGQRLVCGGTERLEVKLSPCLSTVPQVCRGMVVLFHIFKC
jgi:hypothetical protein